ncbi:MAG: hypothetical protein WAW86_10575 [Gammaproteobacteria bacterium]
MVFVYKCKLTKNDDAESIIVDGMQVGIIAPCIQDVSPFSYSTADLKNFLQKIDHLKKDSLMPEYFNRIALNIEQLLETN